jgi:hypothetical protein
MLNGQSVKLCPGSDQRGSPRPGVAASMCDAGAYETQGVGNLYAYAAGSSSSSNCPKTTDPSTECPLGRALALAAAGDTIKLETPAASGDYVGNWSILTPGTSSSEPVTIDGSDVTGATLDGNDDNATGCTTTTCDGPVLFVGQATVVLKSVTIQNGEDTSEKGGGVRSIDGGTVTIIDSTFKHDAGFEGGAIGNNSTLTITDSRFTDNTTGDGGAIDNLNDGSATVTGSTFTDNTSSGDGGAIDNADNANGALTGSASLTVSNSTFTGNTAVSDGGAIDNADDGLTGTVTITDSTLSGDSAATGGEIDTSGVASGVLVVAGSTLSASSGSDVAAGTGGGQVFVAGDVFASGCRQDGGTWTDRGFNAGSNAAALGPRRRLRM